MTTCNCGGEKLAKSRQCRSCQREEQAAKRRPYHLPSALAQRHHAAMQIVHNVPLGDRIDLLAAVVWPEDERLLLGEAA